MKICVSTLRLYPFILMLSFGLVGFSTFTQASSLKSERMLMSETILANNTFIYNPKTLRWSAISDNGRIVRSGHGSGGQPYCRDIHRACRTPSGTYHVMSKGGADCHSSRYPVGRGGAPMPYCMFFSKYYAIHGSSDVPNRNASHGCIRVEPREARWLNSNFIKIGTTVVVKPY